MRRTETTSPMQATPKPLKTPSRINWLSLGLGAVQLTVAAGAVGWWIESLESDDKVDLAAEMPEVVERYFDAALDGDADAVAALFTDEGIFVGSSAAPGIGRSAPEWMPGSHMWTTPTWKS